MAEKRMFATSVVETDSFYELSIEAQALYFHLSMAARDKVCQNCGSTKNLEAHHIKPFATHPELRLDVNNGMTLCRKCHRGW